jgi:alkylation response protein AidB-like acyl-CoA dehydrogenase
MDFNLSDEQVMLRDSVRRFVGSEYSNDKRRAIALSKLGHSAKNWQTFGDFGWLGLGVSEGQGGLGCSFVETAILMEELGRAVVLEPYTSSAVLCAHILAACQNPEPQQVLRCLIAGSFRVALAHGEPQQPNGGSARKSRATRTASGFVLQGEKFLVLDGHSADYFLVSARLEGQHDDSLFLVPRNALGLAIKSYPLIDDSRAADLSFEPLTLDPGALLSTPEPASALIDEATDRAVLAGAAEAVGAMEAVMEITAEYLKNRSQFGQPIGKFQALQHRMAEMFIKVQEARSILYCGLAHVDSNAAARAKAIAAVKVVVGNAGRSVGESAIQLHGGMGLTAECSVGTYYKKLLAFDMMYGDVDRSLERLIHRANLED